MEQVYDWRDPHEVFSGELLFRWRNLITADMHGISVEDWRVTTAAATSTVEDWAGNKPEPRWVLAQFWSDLSSAGGLHNFGNLPSFKLSGASFADRASLCSAVAYCLAIDQGYSNESDRVPILRLSAMLLELSEISEAGQQIHVSELPATTVPRGRSKTDREAVVTTRVSETASEITAAPRSGTLSLLIAR